MNGTVALLGNFRGSYFTEANLNSAAQTGSYTKLDARLELANVDDRWSIALLGKNLNDVHSFSFSYFWPFDGAHRLYYLEETRTFQIQASLRF